MVLLQSKYTAYQELKSENNSETVQEKDISAFNSQVNDTLAADGSPLPKETNSQNWLFSLENSNKNKRWRTMS